MSGLSIPISHGTTSAHAENTFSRAGALTIHRNYLRARGEYPSKNASLTQKSGTTSAHAENTPGMRIWFYATWNYLRARGEYQIEDPWDTYLGELPPRTRRIPSTQVEAGPIVGTTSAHAENT